MARYMCQLQEYFSQPCNPALAGVRLVISPVVPSKKSHLHTRIFSANK
jgi:hypothetical protein